MAISWFGYNMTNIMKSYQQIPIHFSSHTYLQWTCLNMPVSASPPRNQICNLEETLWVTSQPRSKCVHIAHFDLHVCKFQVISVLLFTKPARLHVHVALRPTLPPLWWANLTENTCKEHETCSKVILTLAKIITLNLESHSQFAELLQCCFQGNICCWQTTKLC